MGMERHSCQFFTAGSKAALGATRSTECTLLIVPACAYQTFEGSHLGFRVALIPEPFSITLLTIGYLTLFRRRYKAAS